MTLRCLLFGHIRSRSRASLDEKRGLWVSECRRCRIPMLRNADGTWHVTAAPTVGKLVPVEPGSQASAVASGSAGETPAVTDPAAADSADGGDSTLAEDSQKPVEFSAT